MNDNDKKRLTRLTAILTQLQSKKIITSTNLASKFGVSTRTIYRDLKTLENAGVPIVTEEGRGFTILDGYRIPPIMFTENEANALVTAQLIINTSKDTSLINEFSSVIQKIKAVLPNRFKEQIDTIENKVAITKLYTETGQKSQYLLKIQKALVEYIVIKINYINASDVTSVREIEPFAIFTNSNDEWVLIANCRMRNEFRSFSISKITNLSFTEDKFQKHKITFENYMKKTYNN